MQMMMMMQGMAGRVRRRPERAAPTTCSHEQLEALDTELARRAREAGRLRFEMGVGLERLERGQGHHALGFSSLEAYGLERCERSASWIQKARGLALRLEQLPVLADALVSGSITWSMAAVLATVAGPEDVHLWLAEAGQRTVREMRALALERKGASAGEHLESAEEPLRTLTVTVSREDAWCFERARLLGRHLGERTDADVLFGLVAEATSTLCGELPRSVVSPADDESSSAQRAWEQEVARMRAEAEVRCEASFYGRRVPVAERAPERTAWPAAPEAIDAQLRALAHELVVREIAYGRALEAFFAADGWRRLGYATGAQYARERLGSSLSSVKDKRRLARRLGQLTFLASAVERGDVGYEAARLVAAVATVATVAQWVERAKERTLRHLREDIDAAELIARWRGASNAVVPPSDAEVQQVAELERAVIAGQIYPPPVTSSSSLGRVTLRLRMRASTACDFRHWEALYRRHSPHRESFLRFACDLFTAVWRPRLPEVAFGQIYARDRYRCQSPCCGRRDVTPHHLRFRSRGGDDADENLTSLCSWCHLEGIHGGKISAAPPASEICWSFGKVPHTVVHGRRRIKPEAG